MEEAYSHGIDIEEMMREEVWLRRHKPGRLGSGKWKFLDIKSGGNHKETGKKCPVKQEKNLRSDIPVAKVKQIFQVGKIDPTLSNVLVCSWGGGQKT